VSDDGVLYAMKSLSERLARREYRMLRGLAELGIPAVEVVGVAVDLGTGADAILVTRFLTFATTYRAVFSSPRSGGPPTYKLLDALVELLVRLHLSGFFWGDCSLSNTLFRYDAGTLEAYLVDTETSEQHPELSQGQRQYDVELAVEVELISAPAGNRLRVRTRVAESGDHSRKLFLQTGIDAGENQARRLLNDIASFRAYLEQKERRPVPEIVAANRWLTEVYDPVRDSRGPAGAAGPGRGIPRDPRAPLVHVGAGWPGRGDRRGGPLLLRPCAPAGTRAARRRQHPRRRGVNPQAAWSCTSIDLCRPGCERDRCTQVTSRRTVVSAAATATATAMTASTAIAAG
jgi:hypothetical protein